MRVEFEEHLMEKREGRREKREERREKREIQLKSGGVVEWWKCRKQNWTHMCLRVDELLLQASSTCQCLFLRLLQQCA
jgi:hypothetical protein